MPSQVLSSVENSFTKGLVTEFTGLNFPENAATDCDNCEFTIVGDVLRRQGIDLETNGSNFVLNRSGKAISNYKWNNVGGDGLTQLVVEQVGNILYFYKSSSATIANPVSAQILASTVNLATFTAAGGGFTNSLECQYADGNGYLFVYHPSCDPIYCTYNSGTITGNRIIINVRDFTGVLEPGVSSNTRPTILTGEHTYNLFNQGWVSGNAWSADSTSTVTLGLGSKSFTVASGIVGITGGQQVTIFYTGPTAITGIPNQSVLSGTVTSYVGTTLIINVNSGATGYFGLSGSNWSIAPRNASYLTTWNSAAGNYPSNSDVWWYFKNAAGDFDPATTIGNTSIGSGKAPSGHFILNAFSQQRDVTSGLPGLTVISTAARPKTGTWFQGRVWYAGTDAQQPAVGDVDYYTWTESIYFSKIINTPSDFGNCYQTNDPTSENLFDLLPTDGGVIRIQGCGSVFKLFPIQNGMLVFSSNGIWFITGSQGIGFSANDYTVNKLSNVRSISGSSFVNVQGLPYFWNEEGIYAVQPAKGGGLEVDPITVGTILSFYNSIPLSSKKYVRGDYHTIDYVIKWVYKGTEAIDITNTYNFDKILNYNVYNKAFYPYTVALNTTYNSYIHGIVYVESPGGSTAPLATFKYPCSFDFSGLNKQAFAEEFSESYTDWRGFTGEGSDYESYFVTGYKLHGQGQRRFQIPYIYIFSRTDGGPVAYKIQGLWDYASVGNSGRWSTAQIVNINEADYTMVFRRHRLRGRGLVLQIKIKSVTGEPFDVMGWSTFETQNTGV